MLKFWKWKRKSNLLENRKKDYFSLTSSSMGTPHWGLQFEWNNGLRPWISPITQSQTRSIIRQKFQPIIIFHFHFTSNTITISKPAIVPFLKFHQSVFSLRVPTLISQSASQFPIPKIEINFFEVMVYTGIINAAFQSPGSGQHSIRRTMNNAVDGHSEIYCDLFLILWNVCWPSVWLILWQYG